jgi:putative acyl-CoA dehydrogenase
MQSIPDDRATGFATHDVLNQPGALEDYNAYSDDKPLVEAVREFGADWAADQLKRAGTLVGSEKVQYLARQANRHLPELRRTTASVTASISWSFTPPTMS